MADEFWSSSDFVYTCLRDQDRTRAFQRVIESVVTPGSVVVDAGAGSGILSLFAARAGAAKVYAVEADVVLADMLRRTVAQNGFDGIVEVVIDDIHTVQLPRADVLIMEMIETGLIEEGQISAYNALVAAGTCDARTTCVPSSYATFFQPVRADKRFYGFAIDVIRHDWSFYDDGGAWEPSVVEEVGPVERVWTGDFAGGRPLDSAVRGSLAVPSDLGPDAAIRITGEIGMPDGTVLRGFRSLNGPKIIPLPDVPPTASWIDYAYAMSAGFTGLEFSYR